MSDDFHPENVCLPCYEGEHQHCRLRPDGPRFGRAPEGTPCLCEKRKHAMGVGTCSDYRSGDCFDGHRCGRPAKGTWMIRPRFGPFRSHGKQGELVEVERCGLHLAGLRKQEEHAAKRAAKRAADREQGQRSDENRRAAEDVVEALAAMGWTARVSAGTYSHCDGSVSMQGEDLLAMARELADLRRFAEVADR